MPSVVNFDPYAPRINLDSKQVIAYYSSIFNLKQQINKVLREPVENRVMFLKSGLCLCVCVFSILYSSAIALKCMRGALKMKCLTDLGNPAPDQGETSRKSDKTGKNLIRWNLE